MTGSFERPGYDPARAAAGPMVSAWAVVVAVLLLLVRTRRRSIWIALLGMQAIRAVALLASFWLLDLGTLARGYGVDSGFFVYQGIATFSWSALVFIFLLRGEVRAFFKR